MIRNSRTQYSNGYDDKVYGERVKHNLCWLGDTDEKTANANWRFAAQ